jgi:hypothetical protein
VKARFLKMAAELRLTQRQRDKLRAGDRTDVLLFVHQLLVSGNSDETLEGVPERRECAIADLLSDIRHWCDDNQLSFHEVDRRAYRNYCSAISKNLKRKE